MNAEQERRLRGWLEARDPGEAPVRLRAAAAEVPSITRPAAFPAIDALFRLSAPARALLLLVLLLALAAATVGAAWVLRSTQSFPPRGLITYTSAIAPDIRLVAADGSGDRAVTSTPADLEHAPRWSPDGKTLLFVRAANWQLVDECSAAGSIVLYDLATASERVLAAVPRPILAAEWSPSGAQVAFVRFAPGCAATPFAADGSRTLDLEEGVVDVASGRVTSASLGSITLHPGPLQLRWAGDSASLEPLVAEIPSADGRFVAQSSLQRDTSHRIKIVDRQTGASVDLGVGAAAAWSPDGTAIAFILPTASPAEDEIRYRDRLALAMVGTWQVRSLAEVVDPALGGQEAIGPLYWTSGGRSIYWMDLLGGHVLDVASGRELDLPAAVMGCADLQWQPTTTSDAGR